MATNTQWIPAEIIVHQEVKGDPNTGYFLSQWPGVRVKYVDSGEAVDSKVQGRSAVPFFLSRSVPSGYHLARHYFRCLA